MIKAKLDATKITAEYSRALRRLGELSGFSPSQVLIGEAGIILKTCAGRAKVATQDKTDKRSRRALGKKYSLTKAQNWGDVSVNMGIKAGKLPGTVWKRVGKSSAKFLAIGQMGSAWNSIRWRKLSGKKGGDWGKYTTSVEPVLNVIDNMDRYVQRGRDSMGLSRQSWVQVADELGIQLETVQGGGTLSAQGIAKARAALASNGNRYKNGSGTLTQTEIKAQVKIINSLPYGIAIGMDKQLLSVLGGRAKFFQQAYAKGAFDSMGRAARLFPWMKITKPLMT
jgi:hypothetical protein